MNFIKNLKIRNKLLLLLVVLLIPLLFFLITAIFNEIREKDQLLTVYETLEESEILSGVLHQVQKERALSQAFIASKGTDFSNEMEVQRQNTDVAVSRLRQFILGNNTLSEEMQMLNEIPVFRNQINALRLDSIHYETFNANIRERLVERMQRNVNVISDEDVRGPLTAYVHLVQAKLQLSRVRTLITQALATKTFRYQDYGRFAMLRAFFSEELNRFTRMAPPDILSLYQRKLTSGHYQDILALHAQIEQNPQVNLSGLDLQRWYTKYTSAIEQFKEVEDYTIGQTKGRMQEAIALKNRMVIFYVGFVLLMMVTAVALSAYTVRLIADSLQVLKTASDKVSSGYTDVSIPIHSGDEIGDLADSFRKLVHKNIHLTKVAEAIEQGDYSIKVEVQHENDVLSNALRRMKDNLQRFSSENENRNWQISGIGELNTIMGGAQTLTEVSQRIMHFLGEYLDVNTGALFLMNDYERLQFTTGFALNAGQTAIPAYSLGEGITGQAALNRKVTILPEVPQEYLRITSAFSSLDPVNIIVIPLVFEDVVEGVIELASRKKFMPRQIRFLEIAAEKIAIVLHTLKIHLKTQELLHETQNQAEELETQQEELRHMNTELREQKEQLQASEEELKVSQEELQEKNAELEEKTQQLEEQFEAIHVKNREIEEAKQAVELKMKQVEVISRYKSEFLANMSHELRTPLNSILILSKLLTDNTSNNLTSKQVEHASIIHNSGSDLLKLINDILDLSKIESGQIQLELTDFDPKGIRLEPLFEHTARSRNITFTTQLADNLPETMHTDRFRLEQILKNLLSNAFKFTPEAGTVTLRIYPAAEKGHLRTETLRQQTEVIAFSVQDTGIGIPKDKQQLVFEAFQQADTSTTRRFGGTGLGLAICRELAGLLGGEIHLQSEENAGSTFTLYLPRVLRQAEAQPQIQPAVAAPPPAKAVPSPAVTKAIPALPGIVPETNGKANGAPGSPNRTLLIIEDDKGFSQIVADFAALKHFQVLQAYNGTDGLALARQHRPDAILLDIHLPDITGWEVLGQLKKDPVLSKVQVHIMSAYDKETLGEQVKGNDFIPKPVTLEMLDKAFGTVREEGKTIRKVLVVEDNEGENTAVTELLAAHGIQTLPALTGEQALEQLSKEKVDCVILDLNLPDTGGYELMEKVRKEGKDLPIIVYSGKDLSEKEEAKLKKYANTIIIKNQFSYIRLLDEVQLFLHKINEQLPGDEVFKMKLHIPEEILKDKKVLVVDDDVRNVYSLFSLLESHYMKIVVANNGKEALDTMSLEKDIDIVLMDVMMPEMDGIETTRCIRQNPDWKNLPVIALTAKAMKGDKEKCLEAGASDYISKPIDTDKLLALMRVWLYNGV